jgi:hypothetical protein
MLISGNDDGLVLYQLQPRLQRVNHIDIGPVFCMQRRSRAILCSVEERGVVALSIDVTHMGQHVVSVMGLVHACAQHISAMTLCDDHPFGG